MLVFTGLDGLQRELYAVELRDNSTPEAHGVVFIG